MDKIHLWWCLELFTKSAFKRHSVPQWWQAIALSYSPDAQDSKKCRVYGICPLLVILWAKKYKITFQRNRPKIIEIEKNRKKSKKIEKIFFFQKYQKWVLGVPMYVCDHLEDQQRHQEPIFDIFEKKYFLDFFDFHDFWSITLKSNFVVFGP